MGSRISDFPKSVSLLKPPFRLVPAPWDVHLERHYFQPQEDLLCMIPPWIDWWADPPCDLIESGNPWSSIPSSISPMSTTPNEYWFDSNLYSQVTEENWPIKLKQQTCSMASCALLLFEVHTGPVKPKKTWKTDKLQILTCSKGRKQWCSTRENAQPGFVCCLRSGKLYRLGIFPRE